MNSIYRVIGLMSGTSLDGLDIAGVTFQLTDSGWDFKIENCECVPYSLQQKELLKSAISCSGEELLQIDQNLGDFFAKTVVNFISQTSFQAQFISSHGHTIFHQPSKKLTLQIGSPQEIHALTSIPVIYDFRSLDVALGGQGAPLVPVGDHYLFSHYDACLNLGGIANISYLQEDARLAYDICAFNIVLNYFAQLEGQEFDRDGRMSKQGICNSDVLEFLNNLEYYSLPGPKSLGFENIYEEIIQPLANRELSTKDILATLVEHLSEKIAESIGSIHKVKNILVTGGGAYNNHFIESLRNKLEGVQIIIPESELVEFKEAIVFAFLGLLKVRGEDNVFSSVTGASRNSCSGSILGNL